MTSLRKLLLASTVFLLCTPVYAVDPPQWVRGSRLVNIRVQPNGNIYMTIDKATPDFGCANYTSGIVELNTGAPNFKEQYSLVLSALMADKKIDVYVSGCANAHPAAENTIILRE
ncbi:MAG: hypothetical protein AAGA68_26825 [Pseudomonadota bacterium]